MADNGSHTLSVEEDSPYGYVPTRYVTILFLALFGVSAALHFAQTIRYRMWWLFPTVGLCCILELLGWAGRLWSTFSPSNEEAFQIQIIGTILGPTPLLAATFVISERLIERLGASYSRLSPKWYTILFITCDVVSLVIQGVGGGIAASAETLDGANQGGRIMLGGIVLQLIVIVVYSIFAIEFMTRYFLRKPIPSRLPEGSVNSGSSQVTLSHGILTKRLGLMCIALGFSTLVLFIRAIYRTIELADGWNGRIIETEVYFNVLDGAMVVLALYVLNIAHPGILLATPPVEEKYGA
ncbi:hypothetical protein NLJ89_g4712 [Agrocybe chaxingu]|uniref:RTA1-domain-containing protein n=1 Tax=Agrocybe chaxingu TaxID=84603 RepID=A0A9W8K2J0_9AGAR|nr:hypothetical protein NLJ89_g4712 [Agrocybe chaxingu]